MDSFAFATEVFYGNSNTTSSLKSTDMKEEANEIARMLLHPGDEAGFEMIGKIQSYLHVHLVAPRGEFLYQSTELGRWLHFLQELFTMFSRTISKHSKRELRQQLVKEIMKMFSVYRIYRNDIFTG